MMTLRAVLETGRVERGKVYMSKNTVIDNGTAQNITILTQNRVLSGVVAFMENSLAIAQIAMMKVKRESNTLDAFLEFLLYTKAPRERLIRTAKMRTINPTLRIILSILADFGVLGYTSCNP